MSTIVKSTPAAIEAIRQMQSIIGGGLTEQIVALCRAGDTAGDQANWEGPHADQFRGVWADTKGSLNRAVAELGELRERLARVQADIQLAGGGA